MDEAILAAATGPTLRLYRWRPACISLGRFQSMDPAEIAAWQGREIDVVRRATGGGAIHHGEGEVTYSVLLPLGDPAGAGRPREVYERLHLAIAAGLARLGVQATLRGGEAGTEEPFSCYERAAPFDLALDGRKLVGSAMRRGMGAALVHGSIPTGPSSIAPSAAWVDRPPEEVEAAVALGFSEALGVRLDRGSLTAEETRLAEWFLSTRQTPP